MVKFTNAPLPSLRILTKAIFRKNFRGDSFLDPWRYDNHLTLELSRSAWSMQLITKYRLIRSGSAELNILVPSYFCNSSLAPIREMKVNLYFYPIMQNGEPDLGEISNILSEQKIDIVIGVHFFGNHVDFTKLSKLAMNFNTWFIEDCAHLLNLPKNTKMKSDFQIFSPHKFLAIPDGAILSINKRIFKEISEVEEFRNLHKKFVKDSSRFKSYVWVFKRIMQLGNIGIRLGIENFYKDTLINNSKKFFKPGMTPLSKALFLEMNLSFEEENEKRKENAAVWKNILFERFPNSEVVFKDCCQQSVYLLGLKFSDENDLKEALDWAKTKKYPVCTWPDLPEEVLHRKDFFKNSLELRNHCIFFHVHSSIRKKDIESSV